MNKHHDPTTSPSRSTPRTSLTLALLVVVAGTGGTAIVLLTIGHQLWIGLGFAGVAAGTLWVADRRLRRRAKNRRETRDR